MPSNFQKRDGRLRAPETRLPEYYVMLCAHRYTAAVGELAVVTTAHEKQQLKTRLAYILESGSIEYQRENERRERSFPQDLRNTLVKKDGSIILCPISREESEMLRYSCAVPAFNLIDNLSAVEMQGLADMFEGWAQGDRMDCVGVARLHGWADGLRSLVEVIGIDYIPPEPAPGNSVSLMKFMALQIFK